MFIKPIKTFETEAISLLKACCSEFELAESDKYDEKIICDFWLPNGCGKLNLPENTAVETIYHFLFDTIDRLKVQLDKGNIKAILVITNDNYPPKINLSQNELRGRFIIVMTISELRIQANSILDSQPFVSPYTENRIIQAKRAFKANRVTLFLGAGVSIDAELADWKKLQEMLLSDYKNVENIKLNELNKVDRYSDIVTGRYIESILTGFETRNSGKRFDKKIKDALYRTKPKRSELVAAIVEMTNCKSVESIITYNYDDLLEQDLKTNKIPYRSIYEGGRTSKIEKPIYHIHGYAPQFDESCSKLVFSEEEYHEQYKNSFLWSNIEQLHALNRNTCFFIGLSMLDPNLRRLLDFSNNSYKNESSAPHFAFLKREQDSREAINVQTEKVLISMGVNVIWYQEHKELPKMLREICGESRAK